VKKQPYYVGKPNREIVDVCREMTGFSIDETIVVGDRLYTDIALGKKHGVTAILVLTGETTTDDVEKASECDKPDMVFSSLEQVNELIFGE
jgi:ribonucleotide monophosphatase NagD (HAD superfamily)